MACSISDGQWQKVFEVMAKKTQLENLMMYDGYELKFLNPWNLSKGLNRLKKISVTDFCDFSEEQTVMIFKDMAAGTSLQCLLLNLYWALFTPTFLLDSNKIFPNYYW